MKQKTLMKNANELLEIMPWYVKEYYQAARYSILF